MSIRHLKKLTQTAETNYATAVSLERNPATFGDAVIDISNSLNAQSANAFKAVERAFPSAFMDATLGDDPAGIRPLLVSEAVTNGDGSERHRLRRRHSVLMAGRSDGYSTELGPDGRLGA